ncbi:MAG: hypothetical protein Q7U69_08720 [Sulfuricurvum sp.]|uniref:hypothetical protein n=1 Tax=Sulfuricurvum sp. TaxID=2025608 RepID=UPI0027250CA8|nr:hypothetical protein [Sulfuricurvum sp.]MDO9056618.1 hypothetical protein [Sulfuricurvum sp.]
MQTITLEVQESVSEKFMCLLSHFKKDEIAIINNEWLDFLERLSISEKEVNEGKIKPFDLEDLTKNI